MLRSSEKLRKQRCTVHLRVKHASIQYNEKVPHLVLWEVGSHLALQQEMSPMPADVEDVDSAMVMKSNSFVWKSN